MIGKVIGWVQRRHEGKGTLRRIPLRFVIDVVKDQAVQLERLKSSDRCVGDLLRTLAIRCETRRGEGKEQKLALAVLNTAGQIHKSTRGGGRGRRYTNAEVL